MSGLTGGGNRTVAPPPPPPPAARAERVDMPTRARRDEMARRPGRGATVLSGETTGSPMTGSKRLLGE